MFKKVLALGLVASASAAAPSNLRLRGGGAFSDLTKAPGALDAASTGNSIKLETKAGGDVGIKATMSSVGGAIKSALKMTTAIQGVDLTVDLDDSGGTGISASADHLVDGLKLSLDTGISAGSKLDDLSSPKITAEYANSGIDATVSHSGDNTDISATYAVNGDLSAGVSTTYDGSSLGDINLAAAYKAGASAISAAIHGLKGDSIALTASHKVDDSLDVAGTFSTADSKFAVGAGYKIDGSSHVTVNANSDGIVNVGYDRDVSDSTSLKAGLEIDANDTGKRKAGVQLSCHI